MGWADGSTEYRDASEQILMVPEQEPGTEGWPHGGKCEKQMSPDSVGRVWA